MAERADGPNHHACGTFGTSAAEQPLVPKASGDPSSATLAHNMNSAVNIIAKSPFHFWKQYRAIESEIRERHAGRNQRTSLLQQILFWFQIQREVSQEIKKRSPSPYSLFDR